MSTGRPNTTTATRRPKDCGGQGKALTIRTQAGPLDAGMTMDASKVWIGILIGFAIVVAGVVVGGVYTSDETDVTAATHGTSAGRPADPKPNMIDDKTATSKQRSPATRGSGAVAPD